MTKRKPECPEHGEGEGKETLSGSKPQRIPRYNFQIPISHEQVHYTSVSAQEPKYQVMRKSCHPFHLQTSVSYNPVCNLEIIWTNIIFQYQLNDYVVKLPFHPDHEITKGEVPSMTTCFLLWFLVACCGLWEILLDYGKSYQPFLLCWCNLGFEQIILCILLTWGNTCYHLPHTLLPLGTPGSQTSCPCSLSSQNYPLYFLLCTFTLLSNSPHAQ